MAKIEMKNWVKRMVERHAQVVVELNKANEFLNNALNNKDVNKVTVANLALVVRDLKNLAKDYEIIFHNENVEFTPDGEYYIKVAYIEENKNKDNHEQGN